jgi:CheY-like chemotaxis protein
MNSLLVDGQSMFQMESSWMFTADKGIEGRGDLKWNTEKLHQPRDSRQKVLVVDDQNLIADTLAEILNNAGFDAVPAYDGREALEKASRFHPDWIMTDVLMPRMNGVELAIAIRKNYPKTSILLLSGQAGISEMLEDGRRQGYQFELIAKPVHPLKLIQRITEGA